MTNEEQLRADAAARRRVLNAAGLTTYAIGERDGQLSIVCLCCGLGTSNPLAVDARYCAFCEELHHAPKAQSEPEPEPAEELPPELAATRDLVKDLVQRFHSDPVLQQFREEV